MRRLNGGLWRVYFQETCKLLILERETGIEPATNSLEGYPYFENKEHMRHGR